MSVDQFVSLPPDVLSGSQKFEIINLLGAVARFALPGAFPGSGVERDLDARYAGLQAIGLPDAVSWLTEIGVKLSPLDSQVAAIASGDPEPLHQALQQGNDAQILQLLAIDDASKLIEMEDAGEDQLTPHPLWSRPVPCLLLRLGYNTAMPYAYYAASLPGDSRRPIKIDWQSIVAAGVAAAVAILPPAKPLDLDRIHANLHIINQAFTAITSAHADIMDALGQAMPEQHAMTEQAV